MPRRQQFSLVRGHLNAEEEAMTERTVERRKSSPQHRAEYAAAKAAPTEHMPRLVTTPQGRHLIHGAGAIGQFNNRLAVLITKSVGTMWAAYVFALIGLISFPQAWNAFVRGDTVTGAAPQPGRACRSRSHHPDHASRDECDAAADARAAATDPGAAANDPGAAEDEGRLSGTFQS